MAVTSKEVKSEFDISEEMGIDNNNNNDPISYTIDNGDYYSKPSTSNNYDYSTYGDYSHMYETMDTYSNQTKLLGELLDCVIINKEPAGTSTIKDETDGSQDLNKLIDVTTLRYVDYDINFNGEPLHDAILLLSSNRGNNVLFTLSHLIDVTIGTINNNEIAIMENNERINECQSIISSYQNALNHAWDDKDSMDISSEIDKLATEIENLQKISESLTNDNIALKEQLEKYKVDQMIFQELSKTINNIYIGTQEAEDALADLFKNVYGNLANVTTFDGLDYNIYSFSQKGYNEDGKLNPWDYFKNGWDKEISGSGCGPTSLASCLATMLQRPEIIPSVLTSSLTDKNDNKEWKYLKIIDEMNEKYNLNIYYSRDYSKGMKDSNGNYVLMDFLKNGGKLIVVGQDGEHYKMILGGTENDTVIICDPFYTMDYKDPTGHWGKSKPGVPCEVSLDFAIKWEQKGSVAWIADRPIEEVMGIAKPE